MLLALFYLYVSFSRLFLGNVSIPFCLRCTFERVLQRVILWMSSGGIQTVLHKDVFDSFYCLLDGTKDFYLVDSVRCRQLNFNQYFFIKNLLYLIFYYFSENIQFDFF